MWHESTFCTVLFLQSLTGFGDLKATTENPLALTHFKLCSRVCDRVRQDVQFLLQMSPIEEPPAKQTFLL